MSAAVTLNEFEVSKLKGNRALKLQVFSVKLVRLKDGEAKEHERTWLVQVLEMALFML